MYQFHFSITDEEYAALNRFELLSNPSFRKSLRSLRIGLPVALFSLLIWVTNRLPSLFAMRRRDEFLAFLSHKKNPL